MHTFCSGSKRNYYGKADVVVYLLHRYSRGGSVFGANVTMLVYGDAFWPTYTHGDNTGLIATDSMKNFIQRETINFEGDGLDRLCRFLAEKFLAIYPQVEGLQVSAEEIPYGRLERGIGFAPAGPDRAFARVELNRTGIVEVSCGLRGFRLMRVSGSAFKGFVRDAYTTLPDLDDRPLHMWLDLQWQYSHPDGAIGGGVDAPAVRGIVHDVFETFRSGSIQQVIYELGTRIIRELPSIAVVDLEANNRTWDLVEERGDQCAVFTDARPPYGCLGLRLTRSASASG